MPWERQRQTKQADESTQAAPSEILARPFDALPRHGLQRLFALDEPAAPRLVDHGDGALRWFRRNGWRVFSAKTLAEENGTAIARFRLDNDDEAILSYDPSTGRVCTPFDLALAYDAYVSETSAAATVRRKLSARQLNTFYRVKRFIPRPLQLRTRRLFVRWQGVPKFPAWPLDRSVVRLLHLYAFCVLSAQGKSEAPFRWFWPGKHRAALSLTHDVEGEEGLRLALELADLEEDLGFRSSFNLGGWYRVDPGLLRELTGRGFEIGVHGLRHDRSLFSSRAAFEAQQPALARFSKSLDASVFCYPSTYLAFEC